MTPFAFLMLTAFQVAGGLTSAPSTAPYAGTEFDPPELVCTCEDRRLNEASGIVAGHANPDLYYTHNDSGGKPIVYVLDRDGHIRAEVELEGAKNVDWEDIALAPGTAAGTFDLCAADIGDNNEKRREVQIYRFAEPRLDASPASSKPGRTTVAPTRYTLRYADGPRNAEALVVHPRTGDGFILSKKLDGSADIYRIPAPWPKDRTIEMQRVGKLMFPDAPPINTMVTAADLSLDGSQLVTRSYTCGWLWTLPTGERDGEFERLIRQTPIRLDLAAEPQGEGICFSADGRCLLTVSEGSPTRLFECCRRR
jgi:hypothetical protein